MFKIKLIHFQCALKNILIEIIYLLFEELLLLINEKFFMKVFNNLEHIIKLKMKTYHSRIQYKLTLK